MFHWIEDKALCYVWNIRTKQMRGNVGGCESIRFDPVSNMINITQLLYSIVIMNISGASQL